MARTGSAALTGLKVVVFENRRAAELATLIRHHGGQVVAAPALQEVPAAAGEGALDFAADLLAGRIDVVVLQTGVGTHRLAEAIEERYPRAEWLQALSRTTLVVRSPKALQALRQLGGPEPAIVAPEPHTWREVAAAMASLDLQGKRVAVQEYGTDNEDLHTALAARGAQVQPVVVYRYALPDDTGPLRAALRAIAAGEADVLVFTTPRQVDFALQVAREMGLEEAVRAALPRLLVAAVGPSTAQGLAENGFPVDLEPEHPRMGHLVHELAQRGPALLAQKRAARG